MPEMEIKMLPIEKISPSPFQPRTEFAKDSIQKLAKSISKHGLIQPIAVKPTKNGSYQIIAGERRWRAFHYTDKKEIPAIIKDVDTPTQLIESLVENIHREDLKPIEKSDAIYQIFLAHDLGLSEEEKAPKALAKKVDTVYNKMRRPEQFKTPRLTMGEKKIRDIVEEEIQLGFGSVREYLEGASIHKDIKKQELEKPPDKDFDHQVISSISRIEDSELQKQVHKKLTKEDIRGKEAQSFITSIKKASEPVKQAMLETGSKITPEIADTIQKELPDEYEQQQMIDIVKEHGLDSETIPIWVQDMRDEGVKAFEPKIVEAKGAKQQTLKRWQQLDNATQNFVDFYSKNREELTHGDLKKLYSGLEESLQELTRVYEEVSKMLGKKVKYVKEMEV